jgi:hypothetical protein
LDRLDGRGLQIIQQSLLILGRRDLVRDLLDREVGQALSLA